MLKAIKPKNEQISLVRKYFYLGHAETVLAHFTTKILCLAFFNLLHAFYFLSLDLEVKMGSMFYLAVAYLCCTAFCLFALKFLTNSIIYRQNTFFAKKEQDLDNYRISKQDLLNLYLKYNMLCVLLGTFIFSANLILIFLLESNLVLKWTAVLILPTFILYHFLEPPFICKLHHVFHPDLEAKNPELKEEVFDAFSATTIKKIKKAKWFLKWELDLGLEKKQTPPQTL